MGMEKNKVKKACVWENEDTCKNFHLTLREHVEKICIYVYI
jgi:hypothetical protein